MLKYLFTGPFRTADSLYVLAKRNEAILNEVVLVSASGAKIAVFLEPLELNAALAHPAMQAGRVAVAQAVIRDIPGHHCACADKAIIPQGNPAYDRRVRPDGRATLHQCGAVLVLAVNVAARVEHIGENHRRTQEGVVFDSYPGID